MPSAKYRAYWFGVNAPPQPMVVGATRLRGSEVVGLLSGVIIRNSSSNKFFLTPKFFSGVCIPKIQLYLAGIEQRC